jgi:hypothetical protein
MERATWRRAAAVYLTLFFLAVAAAPHHHLNGLEDLLLDQRSDSGLVVETDAFSGSSEIPAIGTFSLVPDSPCLACFSSDFVAAPGPVIQFTGRLERLSAPPVAYPQSDPDPAPRDTASRAPPSLS